MKLFKHLATSASALAVMATGAAAEISGGVVKIGLLTDMSATYSDVAGPGTITAAEMAIEEFGGQVAGAPIELVSADHQNKADIAANKARQWGDTEGVDAFAELVTTSVAMAVFEVAKQQNKITLVSGAASSPLTNDACIPTGLHWTYIGQIERGERNLTAKNVLRLERGLAIGPGTWFATTFEGVSQPSSD